jgi:septal ring factor EnvC (AmiA/AmiB activator)
MNIESAMNQQSHLGSRDADINKNVAKDPSQEMEQLSPHDSSGRYLTDTLTIVSPIRGMERMRALVDDLRRDNARKDARIRKLEREKSSTKRFLEEIIDWLNNSGSKFMDTANHMKGKGENWEKNEQAANMRNWRMGRSFRIPFLSSDLTLAIT